MSFIRYYIEYLLAFEKRLAPSMEENFYIPFCIMTSDDTHKLTVEILENNNYFGKPKEQITIVKQEKVPALTGIDGKFALEEGTLEIVTKPHGHGDVHTLLHLNGVAKSWREMGKKWTVFFQDTNPLIFRCIPQFLAVSKQKDFDVKYDILLNR